MSRIDPNVETERIRREVLLGKSARLDAPDRALAEEDLRRAGILPWTRDTPPATQ